MAYGQILNGQVAGALAHNLNSAAFCAFATQDITAGGAAVARPAERLFVPAAGKNAATVTVTDSTALACTFSIYLTTQYSLVDVGPIVAGAVRAANQVSPYLRVGRPSYRSLHAAVPVNLVAGDVLAQTPITHLLRTAQLSGYATPNTDPWDGAGFYGGAEALRWWFTIPTVNTYILNVARADGAQFNNTQTMTYDVMVCAREPIAGEITPVPTILGPHHSVQHPPFANAADTGDYGAGQRVGAPRLPSYMSQYSNVTFGAAPGVAVEHNLAATVAAPVRMALFGPIQTPGQYYPYILNRATTANTSTIANVTGGAPGNITACHVAILRNYSRHVPLP